MDLFYYQQGEGKDPIHISMNKQAVDIMKNQQEQIRKLMEHKQNDKLNSSKKKYQEQMKIIKGLKDELANLQDTRT